MESKVLYITGGERSGKSSFGQKLAQENSTSPIYLATSEVMDDDFLERVERHKADRGAHWQTIEEPINISKHDLSGQVVLLDCVTLWLYNIFYECEQNKEMALQEAKTEWAKFTSQDFQLYAISNELGMGVHGTTAEIRKFVELQGWMNQHIASLADEAWFMVSGIPMKIKP